MKNIGNEAFKNCSSLESFTIPNSVTSIGSFAFENCDRLASITIPNSVTSVGNGAFQNSGITSLTIGMENIGSGFQEIRSLKSLTILDGVVSIGDNAFKNCEKLESVTIPNSVTSIGSYAFEKCSSLESVTIPNSVTSIGDGAFQNSGITSATIPNSVTSIGYGVFKNSGITSLTIGKKEIGSEFREISSLRSVTILDGVTSIGGEAFYDCSSLTSITIPNSVTSIGNGAFQNSGITSVTIPNSVTSIGGEAFAFCSNLASATIPNSVTSIGGGAFVKCSSLESVTIPNSVTSIEPYTFYGCSSLESVTIPNSVTSIGDGAFADCENLTSVILNGNPRISADAFSDATVTMNLTASNIDGNKWTTFYNNGYNFQADGNTTVYKATVDGSSLVLTEVEDKIVNRGTAVILKSSGNPVMTLTGSESSDTNGNDLRGISDRTLRSDVINNNGANAIYTMGNTSAGFGFHKYTGEYVPAQKAFLPLNTSNGAKAILTMVFADVTTGVKSVSSDNEDLQNDWYSLDGTRLNGKPSQPGIYINGRKKVVVK